MAPVTTCHEALTRREHPQFKHSSFQTPSHPQFIKSDIMDATPSPNSGLDLIGKLLALRDCSSTMISRVLSPAASPVVHRQLAFNTAREETNDEVVEDDNAIRCKCKERRYDKLSASFVQRRAEFEQLSSKERQKRTYVELSAMASQPDPVTSRRKVTTRYALIQSVAVT